ncbi:DUF1656 domain-containing protein [Mesorhizobium sp. BR1-1-9]|uniref:DUF1656 domain-containing protein n=1 Tax=unclassified Mesorhizobium TaxID=325217 RepID=UPI00112C9B73|nr:MULTISPECIES: DUF1656 domain-containing protein [unclassified Mesorhizobium]MBZ9809550.1 DUF1656 domain-containing protein [Mesorhizobium sp. ESP-6-2]MBZ9873248.1 DUF1656 domain-containing protein [Mesorhizobium sp. BR1-1-9]MBZ9944009.1 DUF1656 domain-containing protein [Mesorhizobium sp. BR1-1-13]TPM24174.1 DUF1656 domain-containing protein [Mesorhizobium sp. B2-2-2]
MQTEINILGVYLPGLLVLMLVAFAVARLIWQVLSWTGIYGLVWHRALFNLALYVLILGAMSSFSDWLLP